MNTVSRRGLVVAAAAAGIYGIASTALAGPAKGTVDCEGAKHSLKTAVALWVPEKRRFQVMFYVDQLSDADQALVARLEGASILGRQPKGAPAPTADDMKKRSEFGQKRAALVRGDLKAAADKVEFPNIDRSVLVSVNCGPNNSFNVSMRVEEKDANYNLAKQFPTFTMPLKAGATIKLATGKFSQKPDPKKPAGSKMTAMWQFQGEAKVQVIE